jgi:hypothetical protein
VSPDIGFAGAAFLICQDDGFHESTNTRIRAFMKEENHAERLGRRIAVNSGSFVHWEAESVSFPAYLCR